MAITLSRNDITFVRSHCERTTTHVEIFRDRRARKEKIDKTVRTLSVRVPTYMYMCSIERETPDLCLTQRLLFV